MDKFGIFKLLNSFFNFYEQNKPQSSNSNNTNNILSNLLSSINSQTPPQKSDATQNQTKPEKSAKVLPPLQNSMLGVINSHDELVKRVKQKNSAPK